jgi:hypothetical protein
MVDALNTHRRPPDLAARDLGLGMDKAVAPHRRDEHRVGEPLAEHGNRGVDLVPDDAAHAVRGERIVVEGAPVLAQRPLLARPMGDEDVDALAQLGLGVRFEEVDVDDARYLSMPLRMKVTGSFSASSWTCAHSVSCGDSTAAAARPAPANLSISLREAVMINLLRRDRSWRDRSAWLHAS